MRNRHIQCHLVNHLWIIVTPSRKGMMLGSETERGLLKENIGRSKLLEVSKPEVFKKKHVFLLHFIVYYAINAKMIYF